jgi:hypothetical protein
MFGFLYLIFWADRNLMALVVRSKPDVKMIKKNIAFQFYLFFLLRVNKNVLCETFGQQKEFQLKEGEPC